MATSRQNPGFGKRQPHYCCIGGTGCEGAPTGPPGGNAVRALPLLCYRGAVAVQNRLPWSIDGDQNSGKGKKIAFGEDPF